MSPVLRRKIPQPISGPVADKRGYTIAEAAHYCGVSKYQVRQWAKQRKLHPAQIGEGNNPAHLYDRRELDALLDKQFEIAKQLAA